ncbi:hypothetical protein FF38_05680 [Lucilia cuprina]|uniref:Secreted protein n=1 Tax=Lucilia cuprina TaxID=7375 RepID=A0A0L0C8D7_LUCCU|nr:uncharacterized protein LOC111687580 [Lucilia cuprina]KAI8122122.1 hypothetical protein CVS40_7021 [Lucilia cuprina]KNC28536.1 hypothetical protein FF38_05680 [Lucilia cuprina]
MFIKNFKLFATCVLCLNIYTQARSVSQMGDVYISISEDKWICDKIECPLDAFRCFVSKSNEENPSVLKRVNTCYTKDNQALTHKEFESPIDPSSHIRVQMTSTRNGNMITASSGLENFDEKKFQEEMNKIQANIKAQMNDLHVNLQKMNEDIHSNIQNQMRDLQHNLNEMQYNLAHMFQ